MKFKFVFFIYFAMISFLFIVSSAKAENWKQYYAPNYYPNYPKYIATYCCDSKHFNYDYEPDYGYFYVSIGNKDYCDYDEYKHCNPALYKKGYYWDDKELKWKKDLVYQWVNKGDWREKVKKARAVVWLANSWDNRYIRASGEETRKVFSYNNGATDTAAKSSTNWRYEEAYDPLIHGVDSYQNYYYKPKYDSESQTWNWRY